MRAAVLDAPRRPLRMTELADPVAGPGQVRLRVSACGVCRTDLHLLDGELEGGHLRDVDGGFAELAVADERYCLPLPEGPDEVSLAPLLCGGMIGHRALRLAGEGARLGLYGFGSAAHMICQVAAHEGRRVFAFTRPGDTATQAFAMTLGAVWAGDSVAAPPEPLDAALIFAPDGALVPLALQAVAAGGTVVCAGIHMSDIPSFPYAQLWGERVLRSVANLTRDDGIEFLELAAGVPVRTQVTTYPLERVQAALDDLRGGRVEGSAVITVI